MNKFLVGLVIGALIVAGGIFYMGSNENIEDTMEETVYEDENIIEETVEGEAESADEVPIAVEEEMAQTANRYSISNSATVSYVAQKEFFSKPTDEILGTTDGVTGSISVDDEKDVLSVDVRIKPNFESGQGGRDADVQKLFTSDIVIVGTAIPFATDLTEGVTVSVSVPLNVTINETTKEISFDVSASLSNGVITTTGSSSLNLNDFNITPPSLLNVYTVNEVIGVRFAITAS